MPKKKKGVRKARKKISEGRAYIQSTFNNTTITITDMQGNVVAWGSSGTAGFKGSRKGTPYAAQLAARDAAHRAMVEDVKQLFVPYRLLESLSQPSET